MPESRIVIKSGNDMGVFLTELTRQVALRRLNALLESEDEIQDKLASDLNSLSSTSKVDEIDEDDEQDKDSEASSDDVEEISSQIIIEKLNTIRSGHSLKRSDIREQMEEYIDALNDAEKVALNAFLEGIAAIITGAQESDEAEEPRPEVKMKTSKKVVDKVPVKKVVVADEDEHAEAKKNRSAKKKTKTTGSSTEDTTPPIKVS